MKLVLKKYEKFILKLAKMYHKRNPYTDFDDIVQAGWLGLLDGYTKFDETKGTTFLTYATWYIKKYMLEALHDNSVIKFPADVYRAYARISQAKFDLQNTSDGFSIEDLVIKTGFSEKKIQKYERYFAGFCKNLAANGNVQNPISDEYYYIMKSLIQQLPTKKREWVLDRLEGKSFKEMGEKYNCSIEWVRFNLNKIISQMKRAANAI